jgi:uncharacterized SAM-binding protein YcdF (DUF218 family)
MIHDIAKFLTNPLLYIWIGLLVSVYQIRGNRRRLIIVNIMFYCLCIGFSGSALSSLWRVNDSYNENIIYDAAIILTGVIETGTFKPKGDTDYNFSLTSTSNRLIMGISFVKSGHAKSILFGNWTKDSDEGSVIRRFAEYQGLKEEEIIIYGDIRNTSDEAKGVKKFLEKNKYKNVILITSGMHMRRALGTFNRLGMFPDTYSVGKHFCEAGWKDFIPSVNGAKRVQCFFHELFGYVGYCLKGNI